MHLRGPHTTYFGRSFNRSKKTKAIGAIAAAAIAATAGLYNMATSSAASTEGLWASSKPAHSVVTSDHLAVELGVKFTPASAGSITGIRFYKDRANTGTHTGSLWSASGDRLATGTFVNETAKGWQTLHLSSPVSVVAGSTYVASYFVPSGNYAYARGLYEKATTVGSLTVPADGGVYTYDGGFPQSTFMATSYLVDVTFAKVGTPTTPGTPGESTTTTSTTKAPKPTTTTSPPATAPPVTTVPVTAPPVTAPPVTATPVSAPPVTNGKNCASAPSACGFPDATNTGFTGSLNAMQPGSTGAGWSVSASGDVTVNGDGAVIDGYDISGNIEVYSNNVTIKNSKITATGETWGIGLRHANNVTVQNVTISSPVADGPQRLEVGIKDIYGDTKGSKILANNIFHASTAIQIANGLFQDNYIHDYGLNAGDHLNGISVGGGDSDVLIIRHNTVLDQYDQTDAIALFQDFGNESNKTVDNNLIAGGSYSLYAGGGSAVSNHITITNNRFSRLYFPSGGTFGPVAKFDSNGAGNVWSGNVWDDTGAVLNP